MFLAKKEFWIGLGISLFFLYFFLRGVEWRRIGTVLSQASYLCVLGAVLLNLTSFWLRSLRWRYLLLHVKDIPPYPLFKANMIGFMVLNVFPARIGEFARAFVIGRSEKIPSGAAFATIVVERVCDSLTILFLIFGIFIGNIVAPKLGMKPIPFPPEAQAGGYAMMALCIIVVGGLLLMQFRPVWFEKITTTLLAPFPASWSKRLLDLQRSFVSGINLFLDPWNTLAVAFYSIVMWMVFSGTLVLLFLAFDLPGTVLGATFIVVFLALGVSIPSSPGGVGPYEAAGLWALMQVIPGVEKEVGVSYIFMSHLAGFLPVTLIGLVYAWSEGIKLSELSHTAEAGQEKSP